MQIFRTERFQKDARRLPAEVLERLGPALERLVGNPRHPSLRVKKMEGAADIWELRVSNNYRVTFQYCEGGVILRCVGTHHTLRHP